MVLAVRLDGFDLAGKDLLLRNFPRPWRFPSQRRVQGRSQDLYSVFHLSTE